MNFRALRPLPAVLLALLPAQADPVAFKGAIARALREHAWPLLEKGAIKPIVHATFPLAAASRAHAMMESGENIGKIILTM